MVISCVAQFFCYFNSFNPPHIKGDGIHSSFREYHIRPCQEAKNQDVLICTTQVGVFAQVVKTSLLFFFMNLFLFFNNNFRWFLVHKLLEVIFTAFEMRS